MLAQRLPGVRARPTEGLRVKRAERAASPGNQQEAEARAVRVQAVDPRVAPARAAPVAGPTAEAVRG
jgi:hypothetical protein